MRITSKQLQAKVDSINSRLGYEAPQWDTVGSIRLYGAYGGTGVHRVVNTAGGIEELMPIGTAKEVQQFLNGMLAGLRIGWGRS